ncbi:MAG: hypothetical protein Q4D19_06035 [Lautropia sp.]|nr:hypothetical protein [Lautropia sp.]
MNSRSATPLFHQAILAIAVGCALTACGGGGGGGNDATDTGRQSNSNPWSSDSNPGNHANGGSSPSQNQSGTGSGRLSLDELLDLPTWETSPQRLSEQDDVFAGIRAQLRDQNGIEADTAPEPRIPYEGTFTTPEGARKRIADWIRQAHENCPFAERLTRDRAATAPAQFQCLAGTYEGIDALSLAPCRTTLMADGTVVHENGGVTLKPFRILPETFQYSHTTVYGKPLLMANNYAAPWSFGQFMDLDYADGELPISESGATRYEYAAIDQENLNADNGPLMARTCILVAREY